MLAIRRAKSGETPAGAPSALRPDTSKKLLRLMPARKVPVGASALRISWLIKTQKPLKLWAFHMTSKVRKSQSKCFIATTISSLRANIYHALILYASILFEQINFSKFYLFEILLVSRHFLTSQLSIMSVFSTLLSIQIFIFPRIFIQLNM